LFRRLRKKIGMSRHEGSKGNKYSTSLRTDLRKEATKDGPDGREQGISFSNAGSRERQWRKWWEDCVSLTLRRTPP
jgi:hypothetical protein